jgi:hypothetical protein
MARAMSDRVNPAELETGKMVHHGFFDSTVPIIARTGRESAIINI